MMRKLSLLSLSLVLLLVVLPVAAQAEPVMIETGFTGPRAEFSPDGRWIAVLEDASFAAAMEEVPTRDNTAIELYDAATGELVTSLTGANDFVASLLFTPDGAQLLGLAANGVLLTWDTASGELLSAARTPLIGTRTPLFWHPQTGELIAAAQNTSHTSYEHLGSTSGALSLLITNPSFVTYGDWRALQDERTSRIYNDIVVVPAPHSDALAELPLTGDEVWTVDVQGQVALLSLGTGALQVLREGSDTPTLDIRDLVVTESGLVSFAIAREDTLYVYDLTNGNETEIAIESPTALLSPDGAQVAQYNDEATALLLTDVAGGAVQKVALPDGLTTQRPLMRLRFSPDGSQLLVAGLLNADEQGVIAIYGL